MAIRVVCPSCGRGGRVPDGARDAAISCPACGASFPCAAAEVVGGPPARPTPSPRAAPVLDTLGDVPAPPRLAGGGPGTERPRIAVPESGGSPTVLYGALGACVVAMLMMLGVIIYLTRHRDTGPPLVAEATPTPPPAVTDAAPVPFEPVAASATGRDPGPAFLAGVPLGGGEVAGAGAGAPVAFEPGDAVAGSPAAASGPVEPAGEVEPVALPGRPLSTAEIVERCEPSVALIEGAISTGTGFLVAPGILATNAHVVESELVTALQVRFPSAGPDDAGPMPAELLYEDPARDLAFLRVPSTLPPLVVAEEHRYVKGEDVTVIGNPGVGGAMVLENAISKGVMSTRAVIDGQQYIQLGIAINPGNSGGPVFDAGGRVIGVATLKTAREEALGFCIPVDDLRGAIGRVLAQPDADAAGVAARHRPVALFHLLANAGAMHAVGLDRHVIAWDEARGGSIRQLIDGSPELLELREGLEEFHAGVGPQLDAEAAELRRDPDVPNVIKDGVTRLAANYARFRQLLARPPDDLGTLLRQVSSAESTHQALTRSVGELLGVEVEESLLAALAPLQQEGPGDGAGLGIGGNLGLGPGIGRGLLPGPGGLGRGGLLGPDAFPDAYPGFGRHRSNFGGIPRPPGMTPFGPFGPGFP